MLVVTTFYVPGFEVEKVFGAVKGMACGGIAVQLKGFFVSIDQTEVFATAGKVQEKLLKTAEEKMVLEAEAKGANAIIDVKYKVEANQQLYTVIVAGTAVKVKPAKTRKAILL